MSHDPTSKDLLGVQDDLQRLLDERLMKQIRTEAVRASGSPDIPVPATPARAGAPVDYRSYRAEEAAAAHNPAGPRSSIGRKRSSRPERTARLHDRIRELEQATLLLSLRAETAEEALEEAERLYSERVKELQDRVWALQGRLDELKDVEQPRPQGVLSKLLGR
ncbi:MAG: hypothetical protein ACYC5Q_02205 [Thermoleophilia bacterium]